MQSFRRRRCQYIWAGIGRAYYGSISQRSPGSGSRNVNNAVSPTSPTTESSAQVDPDNAKGPRQDLNRISPLPIKGRSKRHDINQKDSAPRKAQKASAVHVDPQAERESSTSLRAAQGPHGPKISAQGSSGGLQMNSSAKRRITPRILVRPLRAHKLQNRNTDSESKNMLSSHDRQKRVRMGTDTSGHSRQEQSAFKADLTARKRPTPDTLVDMASSLHKPDMPQTPDIEQFDILLKERSEMLTDVVAREDGLQIGYDIPHKDSQNAGVNYTVGDTLEAEPWQPIGEPAPESEAATATLAVRESDRQLRAQQESDYGPAFTPYTTKLFDETEAWKERPALWDISPGCLLWLPSDYKNPDDTQLLHPHPNSLNHPIVVLSVDVSGPEDAMVTFMPIRSFKSRGAKTSLLSFWKRYLPISRFPRENWKDEPQARESWKDALLYFEHYAPLQAARLQYVDIERVFSARWEDLRCHVGQRHSYKIPRRLCKESMSQLREARTWWEGHFDKGRGLVKWENDWVPTGEMREVFRQRYINPLAGKDKVADDLGSLVAGKVAKDVSEGGDKLALQMEGVRAEMRAEFEEARDKMRAELDRVRTETRAELMTEMSAEFDRMREGLEMVKRAEKAVVELQLAKSARPPARQPEHSASSKLAIWQAANDVPEWSGDLTLQVETMRAELKMSRIEIDGTRAAMEGVRADLEELRGDMEKMRVDVALGKRADAAREAAERQKTPYVGIKQRVGGDKAVDNGGAKGGVERSYELPGTGYTDDDASSSGITAASGSKEWPKAGPKAGPAGTG
ncbi:hypothetical protein V492_06064 [Pseudogymnoascus sp. VKM F-4246]|nr:hypothetical protein V492_06064 [Pseudogymnoascus sp. VKM F-4246]